MADLSPIKFYFDFTSPYGYLASERIEHIARTHQRDISWHPIVLGFIFKLTETKPLVDIPLKGDYAHRDIARSARQHQISLNMPEPFPIGTVAAARACLWARDTKPEILPELVHTLYRSYFVDGLDISSTDNVVRAAETTGVERQELLDALAGARVKELLKNEIELAVSAGVFGSPFIIIDDEPFWGHDRLEHVDKWLESGGW